MESLNSFYIRRKDKKSFKVVGNWMKQTVNVWKYINYLIYKLLQVSTITDMGWFRDTVPLGMLKL